MGRIRDGGRGSVRSSCRDGVLRHASVQTDVREYRFLHSVPVPAVLVGSFNVLVLVGPSVLFLPGSSTAFLLSE